MPSEDNNPDNHQTESLWIFALYIIAGGIITAIGVCFLALLWWSIGILDRRLTLCQIRIQATHVG